MSHITRPGKVTSGMGPFFYLGLGVFLVGGWYLTPYYRGMVMAHIDQQRGRLEIKSLGYPPPWHEEYVDLLENRYHIKVKQVGEGEVSWQLRNYANGYNEAARARLVKRYGKDIFSECLADGREIWNRNQESREDSRK